LGKLRSIQVLRAVAVTGAITSHATFFPHGAAGVDLFFVISGVIIGTVMQGRNAGDFIRARLWRIYPIYWLNLYPLLAIALMGGIATPARVASSITLWPIWGAFAHPYLVPGWTLCFEMLFYALVTLGLLVGRGWLALPLLLAAMLLNLATDNAVLQFVGNPLVLEFCAGLILLNLPKNRWCGLGAAIFAVVAFALSPPLHITSAHLMEFGTNLVRVGVWGLPAAAAVYAALCFERAFGKWASGVVFIGDASYSIYLSHYLVNLTFAIWWPAQVLAMLFVGGLMFRFVERPMLSLRHRHFNGGRRSGTPDGTMPSPDGSGEAQPALTSEAVEGSGAATPVRACGPRRFSLS
jgi:exopolysaccharide production protein ExoZ